MALLLEWNPLLWMQPSFLLTLLDFCELLWQFLVAPYLFQTIHTLWFLDLLWAVKRFNPLSGRLIALLDGPAPFFPCVGSGFCITFSFSSCDSNFKSSLQRDLAPYVLDCSIDLFPLNLLPIARKIRWCRPYTFSNIVLMSSSYRLRQPNFKFYLLFSFSYT